jgi:hypothetical protein
MTGRTEKARRMELRRKTGTRAWPRLFSPPYHRGPKYRLAHACFVCRRSFKLAVDLSQAEQERRCPGCRGVLRWMGRSFRAPRRTDFDQWRKVEILWEAGYRFTSYRGPAGPLPETLKEAEAFVRRNR